MNELNLHRALGCVVGSAVGDALGAPFEFGPPGMYRRRFPQPILGLSGEMSASGLWGLGEATDDSQMAVIEAETLISFGPDYRRMYGAFQAWASSPTTRDVGTTTSAVLHHPSGYPDAARLTFEATGKGAANGCIMRAAPAAVWCAAHPEIDADRVARDLAAVTHGDPVAGWARLVLNRMLVAGITDGDVFEAVDVAIGDLPTDVRKTYGHMLSEGWMPSSSDFNSLAWDCLAQAVWAVRRSASFEEVVPEAIDLGHDTDTVAAVAGAIAGARWGIQAIPMRWAGYVHVNMHEHHGVASYDVEALERLTYRLMGLEDRPFDEPLPLGPTEISDGVHAASLTGAMKVPDDWGVVSLSRTRGAFANHPFRRAAYLIDQPGRNEDVGSVVRDAVDTVDAFVAEGRKVVVHCQTGNSRTGLVLRAWLMRRNSWNDEQALDFLSQTWGHVGLWNDEFTTFLRTDWNKPT